MNILNLLSQTWDMLPAPGRPLIRSLIRPDIAVKSSSDTVESCTACGTCVYTCSPGAITIVDGTCAASGLELYRRPLHLLRFMCRILPYPGSQL